MKKLLLPSLILMSVAVHGAVDYSSCIKSQPGLMGRLNDNGQIIPLSGERVSITKDKDGTENVSFTQPTGEKFGFKITRDKDNRIKSISNEKDYSKLTKKERNDLLMKQAHLLAFDSQGTCMQAGGGSSDLDGNNVSEWSMVSRECPFVQVWNQEQKRYVPADYNIINKKNFSQFKFSGISTWDDFVKAREFDKKRWNADEKVVKAYAKNLELTGWAAPTGTISEFSFKDNKCFVEKVSDSLIVGKTGARITKVTYDHESCSRMKSVFEKFGKKIDQCKAENYNASNEILMSEIGKPSLDFSPLHVDMEIDFSGIPKGTLFDRNRQMCNLYSEDFPRLEGVAYDESENKPNHKATKQ